METITFKEYIKYLISIATEKSEIERLKRLLEG